MNERPPAAAPRGRRLLTFSSGGWVLALTVVVCAALLAWALVPALVGLVDAPPGDGRNIETYQFDLEHLQVPRSLVVPAMPRRDLVIPLDEPAVLAGSAIAELNRDRGKYLLPRDRVIGVTVRGATRAYPVAVLNVHEIVNDVLGGVPIAVTYHWPCDSVMVFDRRVAGRMISFGVSGLVYNSNMLMYERRGDAAAESEPGGESLWSQLGAAAVSGPPAARGETLNVIDSTLTSWADWLSTHPETTVIDRDPSLVKRRYSKADPGQYFLRGEIIYPVSPLPPEDGPQALARVAAVEVDGRQRVYPLITIRDAGGVDRPIVDRLGPATLELRVDLASGTLSVRRVDDGPAPTVNYAAWFAWHAFHPEAAHRVYAPDA